MHFPTADALGLLRIVSIPLISAFIGWFTNALAVKMIFRPRRAVRILGITIQGLVPKRQAELARSIGHTVQDHLLSHADVLEILNRQDMQERLDELIRERIRDFMQNRLKLSNPMLGALISGSVRTKVESLLFEEVRRLVPELSEQMMSKLEQELDFQAIVEDKVLKFELDHLERIIFEIAARELWAIEILGGVLGFLIGLIQVAFLYI
ncbi:DUF445 family protein [uncultured Desulfobulbus sp.]|uniref:DUF445 domain-containing protein n=1 Tax=uncultured Desulfobulbus sp. TaxID=239745 RepID=UPI0029C712BE|nr:DUF445 family protein [uncultured Desulfobulbus sp.]